MAQVSRRLISPVVQKKIQALFLDCVTRCQNQDIAASFIDALLTDTEKIMIAKRVAIALMILKGRTTEEIQDILKVSGQTVWTVRGWLAAKGSGYHALLKDVIERDRDQEAARRDALEDTQSSALWFGKTSWKEKRRQQWEKVRDTKVPF